jgi:hypothetical protein
MEKGMVTSKFLGQPVLKQELPLLIHVLEVSVIQGKAL